MKRRRLSKDEDALWRRATKGVRRSQGMPSGDVPTGPAIGEKSAGGALPAFAPARDALGSRAGSLASAPKANLLGGGDPGLDKRVRRGRLRPERTLDLHGLTQVAARVQLQSFIERAYTDGCRCILVITGKGAGALEKGWGEARAPRGVIRARFEDWINEEPLRSMAARVSPAAPRDGGAGAFYVFLKRKAAKL